MSTHRVHRWSLLVLLCLLCWGGVSAADAPQPVPQVKWNHDGIGVTSFRCVVDGTTTTTVTPTGPVGTIYTIDITACTGVMVSGSHTLVIQACNVAGCTPSLPITVVKL